MFNMISATPVAFASSPEPQELEDKPYLCALLGDHDRVHLDVGYEEWEDVFDITPELKGLRLLKKWDH